MTKKVTSCSENWKQLKSELCSENTKKRPTKRKIDSVQGKGKSNKKSKKPNLNSNKSLSDDENPLTPKLNAKGTSSPQKKTSGADDSSPPDIWFDDVSMHDIIAAEKGSAAAKNFLNIENEQNSLVKSNASSSLTQTLGLKCALVGVGQRNESSVARVCIVNQFGKPVYDKYIEQQEPIKDYRTRINGVRESNFKDAEKFKVVQKEVSDLIKTRQLVGYHLQEDLKLLFLSHPKKSTIDITKHSACRSFGKGRCPGLKLLCLKLLQTAIQTAERNVMEDAQAAMKLYMVYKPQWYRKRFKIVKKRES